MSHAIDKVKRERNLGSCGRKRQMIVSKEGLFGIEARRILGLWS
jgi:hypothetical protein